MKYILLILLIINNLIMNALKNHDILKYISLFINYKHIWYLSAFNKNISYEDDYWMYSNARNLR